MSYLLDTNVVSEIRKRSPNPGLADWFAAAESRDLYLSVLVLGEIRQGVERLRNRGDATQAELFDGWLATLKNEFADRILAVSAPIAERWGRLNAVQPLPVIDGLLAASALEHELTLVTRDEAMLAASGAPTLNPWR
ncbi:MAG: type II toxin-antitoxin system VapC family toxin [Gaiellaceae bacterium MAG52_C11]|nr:type II toxin-antitoxin system VapC family toxin [Candidatus Gaiellasilicea maunaloa]